VVNPLLTDLDVGPEVLGPVGLELWPPNGLAQLPSILVSASPPRPEG
jgi:hypothetical protein